MIPPFTPLTSRKKIFLIGVLVFILCLPLLFSLFVNHWFSQNEQRILASLNEVFHASVAIRQVHYRFFRGILIEDFEMRDSTDPALPSPIRVRRVRIQPSFTWIPHPTLKLGRVVLEEPHFSLRAGLRDLIQMGRFLNSSPKSDRRFGPLSLKMHLSSLSIKRGKVTLLSPSLEESWKQEFEGVQVFLGRQWLGGERLVVMGHIAGNPKASFRIRGSVKNALPHAVHVDLLFDCQQFATAYLAPHLGKQVDLPDEKLTAAIKVKVRKGKMFVSKGKITSPRIVEGKNVFLRLVRQLSPYLRYEVKGEVAHGICRLTKLILKTEGIELKGGGELRLLGEASSYNVSIASGKISTRKLRELLPEFRFESGEARLILTIAGSAERISPSLDLVLANCTFRDTAHRLSWSKVDGRIHFSKDRLVIEELWAFLNNLPIRIRGEVNRGDRPRVVFEMSTYPGQVSVLRPRNPINATVRFIGGYDGKKWDSDLWISNVLYRGQAQEKEVWTLALHGMEVEGSTRPRFPQDFLRGTTVRCRSLLVRQAGKKRILDHLALRKSSFFFSVEPDKVRWDVSEGSLSQGKLFLQSWVDLRHFPAFSWMVTGSLSDADVVPLLHRFGHRYPLTGRLSAEGTWGGGGKSSQLLGRFLLVNGLIGPTVALQRLADETGIEPLRQIQFREFSGRVAFTGGDLNLDRLKIVSDQAELLATLKVREGERVAGILSAKFPEASVRQSSELQWLLHYVGGKDWIDFDFKIAGSLGVPRLQWLSGEFKRKIEAKLPPGMRNQLAREMAKKLGTKEGE
ncbi:MAG: hypothetical protein HY590_05650 [Candidatus Omnitrophica bacterium]|nr:hypothetical protein [Candidatus Omnitrophota bacterium]